MAGAENSLYGHFLRLSIHACRPTLRRSYVHRTRPHASALDFREQPQSRDGACGTRCSGNLRSKVAQLRHDTDPQWLSLSKAKVGGMYLMFFVSPPPHMSACAILMWGRSHSGIKEGQMLQVVFFAFNGGNGPSHSIYSFSLSGRKIPVSIIVPALGWSSFGIPVSISL
jgi:hypothetical protein